MSKLAIHERQSDLGNSPLHRAHHVCGASEQGLGACKAVGTVKLCPPYHPFILEKHCCVNNGTIFRVCRRAPDVPDMDIPCPDKYILQGMLVSLCLSILSI